MNCHSCGGGIQPQWQICPLCGTAVQKQVIMQDSVVTGGFHTHNVTHNHQHFTQQVTQQVQNYAQCNSCSAVNPSGLKNCKIPNCPNFCCDQCGTYPGEVVNLCSQHHYACSCGMVYRESLESNSDCSHPDCNIRVCNRCRHPGFDFFGTQEKPYVCKRHKSIETLKELGSYVGATLAVIFIIGMIV